MATESILAEARKVMPAAFATYDEQNIDGVDSIETEEASGGSDLALPETAEQLSAEDREAAVEAEAAHRENGFEVFAYYKSFHQVLPGAKWGIFYYVEGLRRMSLLLMRDLALHASDAQQVAFRLLQAHERFHFRFDWGALYDELVLGTPLYNRYTQQVYRGVLLKSECYEESLANRSMTQLRLAGLGVDQKTIKGFVEEFCRNGPPGYRDFDRNAVTMKECLLGQLRTGTVTGRVTSPEHNWVAVSTWQHCPAHRIRRPKFPTGKFIKCKLGGRIWIVHPNDADPWPSKPHAHEYDRREKLDLSSGEIFSLPARTPAAKLRPKELEALRAEISCRLPSLQLPSLVAGAQQP